MQLASVYRLALAVAVGALAGWTPPAPAGSAPELALTTRQGVLPLASLRGKVVYLDYWASWCGPCRSSFPWMNEMQSRYGDRGLVIVAVSVDKEPAAVDSFLRQYPARFTIAYDPAGAAAGAMQVKGMPSSYLIDREGNVHAVHVGFREQDKAELETRIRTLLTD
ncbi:MAG TPA: TlpA disulfide reductase family protein [Acidiferrobacterales bacterium]